VGWSRILAFWVPCYASQRLPLATVAVDSGNVPFSEIEFVLDMTHGNAKRKSACVTPWLRMAHERLWLWLWPEGAVVLSENERHASAETRRHTWLA
jgi:hypothetical protein